jgi:hypothetical protein
LQSRIKKVSGQIANGEVELKFEVEEIPDDSRQFIDIIRTDTKTRINSRPMNEAEKEASRKRRQVAMPFDGEDDDEIGGETNGKHDTDPAPSRASSIRPKGRGRAPAKGKRA